KDVGKTEKQRKADALRLEIVRELVEVELPGGIVGIGTDDYVSLFIYIEVTDSPAFDVVESAGGFDRPDLISLGLDGWRIAGHRHDQSLIISKAACTEILNA